MENSKTKVSENFNFPLFAKLLLLSSINIIVLIVISWLSTSSYNKLLEKDQLIKLTLYFGEVQKEMNSITIRRRENLEKTYNSDTTNISSLIIKIDSLTKKVGLSEDQSITFELIQYKSNIRFLLDNIELLGLNEDSGVEGEFRNSIHLLESHLYDRTNYQLLFHLLQARRSEKDYIMRHRSEYIQKVKNQINILKSKIELIDGDGKESIKLLDNYYDKFVEFANAYDKMQVNYYMMQQSEVKIDKILAKLLSEKEEQANLSQKIVAPFMIFSIILGLILTIFYARNITQPVKDLQNATLQVADGNLKVKLSIKTADEFSKLGDFFNQMVSKIEQNKNVIVGQNEKLTEINKELEILNATKDKLFSIIAHDLKNPLAAFKQAMEVITMEYSSFSEEERMELLIEINKSSKHLYETLENLLQWSLSQRGKILFNPIEFELNSVADSVASFLQQQAKTKDISIQSNVPHRLFVYADINMVTTVIRNLISNAIKFTGSFGRIAVNAHCSNDEVIVSVTDTGIGISPDKIAKIFSIESQLTTPGTNNEKGTGLGLLICKEFVEKNGGKIWVESIPNIGTSFYFSLPLSNLDANLG